MKTFLVVFFICITHAVQAQILNVESLRKVTDTSGYSGFASLDVALKKNTNSLFSIANNIHLQYKMKRHLVLFKNDIAFQKIESSDFENSGIQHLRYNYRVVPRIAFETFVQAQYNKVTKIDFRGLAGLGPRFKLTTSDNYRFYTGTLLMYEYEEVSDGQTMLQRNLRGSGYISFRMYPTKNLSIVSTTYYQPKLKNVSDYRISSQSSIIMGLFSSFSFKTTYTYTYDAFPAVGVPKSQYDLTSGVVYSFD